MNVFWALPLEGELHLFLPSSRFWFHSMLIYADGKLGEVTKEVKGSLVSLEDVTKM